MSFLVPLILLKFAGAHRPPSPERAYRHPLPARTGSSQCGFAARPGPSLLLHSLCLPFHISPTPPPFVLFLPHRHQPLYGEILHVLHLCSLFVMVIDHHSFALYACCTPLSTLTFPPLFPASVSYLMVTALYTLLYLSLIHI